MKVEMEVPDSALSALRRVPSEVAGRLRFMAAAKLYEVGELSQERAAELAGLSHQEFVMMLSAIGVSPFQGIEEDLLASAR
jgi:predicted HTH domain antitoxin